MAEEALRPVQVFGRRVREARKRLGWTQQQLADRLDEMGKPTDRATIARTEKGQTLAGLDFVMAVAAALRMAPVYLLAPEADEQAVSIAPSSPLDAVDAKSVRAWIRGAGLLPGTDVFDLWPHVPESERRAALLSGPPNVSALALAASGYADYDNITRLIAQIDDATAEHRREKTDGEA